MSKERFLVSDIGGTNIRIATFERDPRLRENEQSFRLNPKTNKPYGVVEAIEEYCQTHSVKVTAACLGIAGRVQNQTVKITNRPDVIRGSEIAALLNINPKFVLLVNDMPPHLAAVDRLSAAELITLKHGHTDDGGRAILMPGTGVGTGGAVLVGGKHYVPFPSEGGHIDFSPRDEQQEQLLHYLKPLSAAAGVKNVSNEFVFCGEGIRRIFAFITGATVIDTSIPKSEEITSAVAAGGLMLDDPRRKTIDLYLRVLGAAAGNLALMFAATGGIFLGGSICLTLRNELTSPNFVDAFVNSGPPAHRPLLDEIAVKLINYKDSGLLGAGALALAID